MEQRDWLTEDEHIKLVDVGNVFWHSLADLLAEAIVQFEPAIHGTVQAYLQDRCSLYGVDLDAAMQRLPTVFTPGLKMSQECKHAQHSRCTSACWCICHRRQADG